MWCRIYTCWYIITNKHDKWVLTSLAIWHRATHVGSWRHRADSRCAPSQCGEMPLLCNVVSHWPGANQNQPMEAHTMAMIHCGWGKLPKFLSNRPFRWQQAIPSCLPSFIYPFLHLSVQWFQIAEAHRSTWNRHQWSDMKELALCVIYEDPNAFAISMCDLFF